MLKDPLRLAWIVLITSFVAFCVLSTALLLGARWFLFDSTIPLDPVLAVGSGTVSVTAGDRAAEAERATRNLSWGVSLTTDSFSQGYIAFYDPYTQRVVAALILQRDSAITLGDTARPRFEFSRTSYAIDVVAFRGRIEVDIVPDLPRVMRFDVRSTLGLVRMSSGGRYLLNSQENSVTVFNRTGEATIFNNADQARSVPVETLGRIEGSDGGLALDNSLVDILPDGSFDTVNRSGRNPAWGCYSQRDDLASADGTYAREVVNGRSVIHIARYAQPDREASSHAETGCLQFLGAPDEGLPVGDHVFLELRANMLIRYQSLSTCGIQGSECPVMLVMNYLDESGTQRQWIHGLYAYHEPGLAYPLRCATCAIDHERLNTNTWYTFSSGNLIQLLPEDQRPQAVLNVGFYASGHEYEVLLSEVAVLAGQAPQTAEELSQNN